MCVCAAVLLLHDYTPRAQPAFRSRGLAAFPNDKLSCGFSALVGSHHMASVSPSPKPKRAKFSRSAELTTLLRAGFDPSDVASPKSRSKTSYKSPVTLENLFAPPSDGQVVKYYNGRNHSGKPFDRLSDAERLAWRESLHDNCCLMGYLVYSQLLP